MIEGGFFLQAISYINYLKMIKRQQKIIYFLEVFLN